MSPSVVVPSPPPPPQGPAEQSIPRLGDLTSDPFARGGEAGEILRKVDWAQKPIGPVERWPQSLRTALSICLASRHPICIIWGRDRLYLYNDAYAPIVGAKHPWALGESYITVWPEVWDSSIRPILETVERTGEASWCDNLLLVLQRRGFNEECYFSFSFAPTRVEDGSVGGVFTAITETTPQVVGERRLRTLSDLGAQAATAKTPDEACRLAADVFAANAHDIPFALFYLVQSDGKTARLVNQVGLDPASPVCCRELAIDAESLWPLGVARSTSEPVIIDLNAQLGLLPGGPWPEPAHTAVVLPVVRSRQANPYGFIIAGISPRQVLDDDYHSFLKLAATQVATAVANAEAYAEERRRAEALAEIDRAKTAFFSNVSHEFRTPLTLMLGPMEDLLRKPDALPDFARAQLEITHRNSLRLLKLVNSLDFSRIEAGRVQASYERVDLAALTVELASVFRAAVEKAGLKLVIDCRPIIAEVYVDRDMWEKIVFNLLSNAFKFTIKGEIEVRLREVDGRAHLTVRDTGVGVPEAELPNLFKRFHRVENPRSRTHEGTGIGLALAQELAKLHGGTIRVESRLGVGSAFTVDIPTGTVHLPAERIEAGHPVAPTRVGREAFTEETLRWLPDVEVQGSGFDSTPEASRRSAPSPGKAEGVQGARILVADDNADMRLYVRRLLEGTFQVKLVPDGEAALAVLATFQPDLVLSDIMMPRLDGIGLLRAIRERPSTRSLPVILLSARAGHEASSEGYEAGADDYLIKPFGARELLARVSAHLRLAFQRKQAAQAIETERKRLFEFLLRAPASICVLRGPDHVFEFVNPGYLELVGRTEAHELLGKTLHDGLPEIEGQGFFEILDRVYRTGEPYFGKEMKAVLARAQEGTPEERFVNFVYQPTRDGSGEIDGILVHAVDVTEQVQARRHVEDLAARLERERDHTRAREQHLRAIISTTPECVKLVARDGTLLEMNASGLAMIEADSAHRVMGKNVYDLIAPEHRELFRRFNERVCEGELGMLEFDVVGLRGTRRHMETHAAPLRMPDGVTAQLATTRDITNRKRAEAELRHSEKRLRAFFTASSDVLYTLNADCSEMQPLDGKAFIADAARPTRGWFAINIPPVDQPRVWAAIEAAIRAKSTFELEHRVNRADGTPGWTFSRAVPIFDEAGEVSEWFGAASDITGRKVAQEAVDRLVAQNEEQRRLYHAILSSTPDLVYVFNRERRFTYANDALLKMWGRTLNQAFGKGLLELGYEPWHAAMHEREIEQVISTRQPVRGEVPFEGAMGRRVYDYIFVPVLDAKGEIEAVAGITRDVTDISKARETVAERRRELERLVDERTTKLKEAVEQMEEFSYSVSHDLRSPTRAMCSYAEALMEDYGDRLDAEGREYLSRIQRNGARMDRLIRDLLTYSRVSRREILMEPVSVSRLVREIILQYPEMQPAQADIEIVETMPAVAAHEPSLTQALSNLLANAVKFVTPGVRPRVQISAVRRGQCVRVWIEDNGIGIAPELHSRLFGMFERLHPDLSYDGTGIGLAIVRKAIERMGGAVGIESDGKSGSRFWIELGAVDDSAD